MLEVTARYGRARTSQWTHGELVAKTPGMIFPQTSLAAAPSWVAAVLSSGAEATQAIAIQSGGTWFYPTAAPPARPAFSEAGSADGSPANGALVLAPVQPAPTTKVQVLPLGDDVAVFHDAGGWARDPKAMVPAFIEARTQATPARLLWAPALGTPADYALWVYLGVDLFDASPLLMAAVRGEALTPDGPLAAAAASHVLGDGTPWDTARLVVHNLEAARLEMELVRHAIEAGTLRALAERRAYSNPAAVEVLRRFDREHRYLEQATPRSRAHPLPAMTADSVWMPEVETFRRTFRTAYEPPRDAKVLVLLPCSQRKPYKTSRSHRAMARILDDSGIRPLLHEVMVTSPLGLVPRELEEVYPANRYDIPVTGHWSRDEEAIVKEQLAALIDKHDYSHVVVHTGQATFDILRHLLPEEVRHTCLHHPTSREDLARLATELARLKEILRAEPADPRILARDRKLDDLRALASFQFGPAAAEALAANGRAAGHMPYVKLFRPDGTQLATTTADRGVLSLTLDGAAVLAGLGRKRVFIQDFQPKKTSSLFAVGVVGADPDVREGDEVVVVHGDDTNWQVRGCGVAQMSAEEMASAKRGVAVTLRHTLSTKSAPAPVEEVVA